MEGMFYDANNWFWEGLIKDVREWHEESGEPHKCTDLYGVEISEGEDGSEIYEYYCEICEKLFDIQFLSQGGG